MSNKGIAGIVAIEPAACSAQTADMRLYAGLPILVLWGDYVELTPRWAPRLKLCRDFVETANRAGARAEMVMLKDVGFPGASHMRMLDRHSIAIGRWLVGWIDRHVAQ